jgi:hypothetical protein
MKCEVLVGTSLHTPARVVHLFLEGAPYVPRPDWPFPRLEGRANLGKDFMAFQKVVGVLDVDAFYLDCEFMSIDLAPKVS